MAGGCGEPFRDASVPCVNVLLCDDLETAGPPDCTILTLDPVFVGELPLTMVVVFGGSVVLLESDKGVVFMVLLVIIRLESSALFC
jgi:hypothetical protein